MSTLRCGVTLYYRTSTCYSLGTWQPHFMLTAHALCNSYPLLHNSVWYDPKRCTDLTRSNASITIPGETLEVVSEFKYLGSIFPSDATLDAAVAHRVAIPSSAFARLRRAEAWSSKVLSSSTKVHFLQSIVILVLLYGVETWSVLDRHLCPLSVF